MDAFVITQDICNKFIEVNFFVGCMVSRPNRLLQDLTTMSLIDKMITENRTSACDEQTYLSYEIFLRILLDIMILKRQDGCFPRQ